MCDVHALASEAAELEAETEKFLDEALITDIQDTPLTTLEDVIDERRDAKERRERVHQRAKEMLEQELAKQKHEREVKELEDAINVTQQPDDVLAAGKAASKREGKKSVPTASAAAPSAEPIASAEGSEEISVEEAAAALPFKLESTSLKNRDVNPYVLNLTEFLPEQEATRHARDLKAENEILRACLSGAGKKANAFESYLRRSSHTAL